jgi:PPP family 3-phenylpropionic acid transporter
MLCVAALAGTARWLIMATNPSIAVLIGAQLLNGITATGTILGITLVIAARVPSNLSAAAQGMNAVLLGAVLAVATAGSGLLWSHGLSFAYLAMAVLAALGAVLAWPARIAADKSDTSGAPVTGVDQ